METGSEIHVGVIGTNFISDLFAKSVAETSGIKISAVYSRAYETGRAFADKYDIGAVYTDYSQMLKSDIDAVYVASPIFMHHPQTIEAIRYGKHVLCEKMMAVSYQKALEMANAAKEAGVILVEAMRPAFDPSTAAIIDAIPRIGKPVRAYLSYCQYSSRFDRFMAGELPNAFNAQIGNSALSDIGIYPLYLAVLLFGYPDTIESESCFLRGGFEGEGVLKLGYSDFGCEVVYSKIRDSKEPSFIEGEHGSIVFDRINMPEEIVFIDKNGNREKIPFNRPCNNMVYEVEAFRDMILGQLSADKHLEIALSEIKVVSESYRLSGAKTYMPKELAD